MNDNVLLFGFMIFRVLLVGHTSKLISLLIKKIINFALFLISNFVSFSSTPITPCSSKITLSMEPFHNHTFIHQNLFSI